MGLDACVYCDCLEKGRVPDALEPGVSLQTEPDGSVVVMRNGKEIWENDPDFTKYDCGHEGRWLCRHRLGNISLIALLRAELGRGATVFPMLLQKVLYSGSHAGDFLEPAVIPALIAELEKVKSFKCQGNVPTRLLPRLLWKLHLSPYHYVTAATADAFLQNFRVQMLELVDAALGVGKPIAF